MCPSTMPQGAHQGMEIPENAGKEKLRVSPYTHGLIVCFGTVFSFQVYLLFEEG